MRLPASPKGVRLVRAKIAPVRTGRAGSAARHRLAEGMVLTAIRAAGVPLQLLRPALTRLTEQLGIEHVLAAREAMPTAVP
ncbi:MULTISPECIES: hypothetical protein [unclassified Frankia]|uniref:hypothetical protein n=1 Tax=unclassified Frankia TaxID=2632575 RepID=UPI00351D675F